MDVCNQIKLLAVTWHMFNDMHNCYCAAWSLSLNINDYLISFFHSQTSYFWGQLEGGKKIWQAKRLLQRFLIQRFWYREIRHLRQRMVITLVWLILEVTNLPFFLHYSRPSSRGRNWEDSVIPLLSPNSFVCQVTQDWEAELPIIDSAHRTVSFPALGKPVPGLKV